MEWSIEALERGREEERISKGWDRRTRKLFAANAVAARQPHTQLRSPGQPYSVLLIFSTWMGECYACCYIDPDYHQTPT